MLDTGLQEGWLVRHRAAGGVVGYTQGCRRGKEEVTSIDYY